jgi:hypothetical protein
LLNEDFWDAVAMALDSFGQFNRAFKELSRL